MAATIKQVQQITSIDYKNKPEIESFTKKVMVDTTIFMLEALQKVIDAEVAPDANLFCANALTDLVTYNSAKQKDIPVPTNISKNMGKLGQFKTAGASVAVATDQPSPIPSKPH